MADSLRRYTLRHGSSVSHVTLDGAYGVQQHYQLALPQLSTLHISNGHYPISPCPGSGLTSLLDSCTRLTSLKLSDCTDTNADMRDSLRVGNLQNLRELSVSNVYKQQPAGEDLVVLLCDKLASLQQLTSLELASAHVRHAEALSRLTCLEVLSVRDIEMCGESGYTVCIDKTLSQRQVVLPDSLRVLCLGNGVLLDCDVLGEYQQLTRLELHDGLAIESSSEEQYDEQYDVLETSSGSALLKALAKLKQLDTLVLELSGHMVDWPSSVAEYTALTASTNLKQLVVQLSYSGWSEEVWQHVFKSVHGLTSFVAAGNASLDAETMEGLVSRNPGLQELELGVHATPQVAQALQPLASLTLLKLSPGTGRGYNQTDPDSIEKLLSGIAALTSLRSLDVDTGYCMDSGADKLQCLTALRGLTSCSLSGAYRFQAKNEDGPVWQQLLQHYQRLLEEDAAKRARQTAAALNRTAAGNTLQAGVQQTPAGAGAGYMCSAQQAGGYNHYTGGGNGLAGGNLGVAYMANGYQQHNGAAGYQHPNGFGVNAAMHYHQPFNGVFNAGNYNQFSGAAVGGAGGGGAGGNYAQATGAAFGGGAAGGYNQLSFGGAGTGANMMTFQNGYNLQGGGGSSNQHNGNSSAGSYQSLNGVWGVDNQQLNVGGVNGATKFQAFNGGAGFTGGAGHPHFNSGGNGFAGGSYVDGGSYSSHQQQQNGGRDGWGRGRGNFYTETGAWNGHGGGRGHNRNVNAGYQNQPQLYAGGNGYNHVNGRGGGGRGGGRGGRGNSRGGGQAGSARGKGRNSRSRDKPKLSRADLDRELDDYWAGRGGKGEGGDGEDHKDRGGGGTGAVV